MKLARAVVKFRVPILIIAIALMIPSFIGMAATRINYDIAYISAERYGYRQGTGYPAWTISGKGAFPS